MNAAASFLLVFTTVAFAARVAQADDRGALLSGFTMTSWTLADGISVGPVYAMTQDAEGYLWLGTTGGAVRFDGTRFTSWETIYPSQLPRADVLALARSHKGTLWAGFGSLGGSVTVGELREGVLIRIPAGAAPRAATTAVLEDRAGRVWAVSDSTLHRLLDGRWDVMRNGALARAEVVSVREDRDGVVWVGTRQGVFRTRDGLAFELVEDGVARDTSEGADGTLWMTDRVHGARRQGAPAGLIGIDGWGMRLLHDSRGNLWVATTGQGLWRVRDGESDVPSVELATTQTGLSSNAVHSLLEDRDGNIWVGTMLGLHSLTPQELTPISSGALVRAILPDPDGSVWVGTANGLMRFEPDGGTWHGEGAGAPWDIRSLFRDARGQAWAGTDHGLRALSGGELVELPRSFDRPPPCASGAIGGPADALSGAFDSRRIMAVMAVPLAPPAALLPFCATGDEMWAADGGGALIVRRGQRVVATIRSPSPSTGFGPHNVDAIFEDAHGTMWAGGTNGLWRIRAGQVDRLDERGGLPAQRVMAITQSDDGFLWLAADRGPLHAGRRAAVIRIHPSDFERAAGGHASDLRYRIYDASDGLAGVPLGTAAAARSRDGSLWFAFGGSLTVVNPRQLSHRPAPAPIRARIVGVNVDDRALADAGASELPAGTRKVQIDYSALRLTAPRQIRFRYRLEGFDRDWVEAGQRRQAYYTNLAPGNYVFRVQANGDGVTWTVPEAQWRFAVQPAFQQTVWFYLLGGSVLLMAAWGAVQTRAWILNRQFAATLAERTRLSREIHDTMLQSLVGIALQVQGISRRSSPEQQFQLVALRRQVEQYIRETRQAIQDLRSPLLEAGSLVAAVAESGRRAVAAPACFDLSADPIAGAPAATEGELLRIAQEGITNAARHSGATRIRVDLRQEPDVIRLRVTDDGCGFDVDAMLSAATAHYGLTGMQERAARIGGRLTVSSSTSGTVVEAIVPCTRHRQ
jgi:signal transduction histidine kinase/ligand-binding sensor domain-containing protein